MIIDLCYLSGILDPKEATMPQETDTQQMAHIRLTKFDKAHIAAIREREKFIRDTDAIRHALKFSAEFGQFAAELGRKKSSRKSSEGA